MNCWHRIFAASGNQPSTPTFFQYKIKFRSNYFRNSDKIGSQNPANVRFWLQLLSALKISKQPRNFGTKGLHLQQFLCRWQCGQRFVAPKPPHPSTFFKCSPPDMTGMGEGQWKWMGEVPRFTLWHEIITKIILWELFFVIFEAVCALEMSRKERHFQGITREIRNFFENNYFKIVNLCQRVPRSHSLCPLIFLLV